MPLYPQSTVQTLINYRHSVCKRMAAVAGLCSRARHSSWPGASHQFAALSLALGRLETGRVVGWAPGRTFLRAPTSVWQKGELGIYISALGSKSYLRPVPGWRGDELWGSAPGFGQFSMSEQYRE